MAARERLDITKKPDHHLSKDDFQFALDAARRVIAEHPKSPDAHYLATYAQGGLAYAAGQDAVASGLVVEAVLALQRAGKQDHRALQQLLSRPDGTVVAPKGWELAVAYGDARGEALPLLDRAETCVTRPPAVGDPSPYDPADGPEPASVRPETLNPGPEAARRA